MSHNQLRHTTRCAGACVASLAAVLLLQAPSAQAGEVVTTNCLHGTSDGYSFGYRNGYGSQYSSDYGDRSGRSYSFERERSGGFRTGLIGDHDRHRAFIGGGARTENGGGASSEADAGSSSGSSSGTSTGTGVGSSTSYGSDSCIEVSHELVNPYVIQVRPVLTDAEYKETEQRDRLWRDHCKPVIKQDAHGVARYVYAAPGCDYGKYE